MALDLVTNVASLNSQRSVAKTTAALQMNFQRLSSGLRINSAADDAAGLAISDRFAAQIRSLAQAKRNANDGISLIQTADSALSEVTGILTRMRELSVQAANGTLSPGDRTSIDNEATTLKQELDRIGDQTNFNGLKMLDGSMASLALQVGTGNTSDNQITVNMFGTTSRADFNTVVGEKVAGPSSVLGTAGSLTFTLSDTAATKVSIDYSNTATLQQVVDKINTDSVLAGQGVTATAALDSGTGKYYLSTSYSSSVSGVADVGTGFFATAAAVTGAAGGLASAKTTALGAYTDSNNVTTHISNVSMATDTAAKAALYNIDQAINDVNTIRAKIGAAQNRLNVAISNLSSSYENFSSAEGRIRNVDVASETANLTRNQILQQAGVAMLAQANQSPQAALSLLGGR
jgi:flagellin